MRRALFIGILTLLIADACGLSSLLVPETCAIAADDSAPDGRCPGFCVRCTCSCCVSLVVATPVVVLQIVSLPPVLLECGPDCSPTARTFEILHVPKFLLT